MSSNIVLPYRGQCIQTSDNIQHCQCQWFFPPNSPLLDQDICGLCGHVISAHADYVSRVVNHYPANRCAAYAQKTRLTQRCTCEAQFCEHIATDNSYRLPEPWTVLDYFNPDSSGPSSSAVANGYSDDVERSFSPPSATSNTAILSGDARSMLLVPVSTSLPSAASTSSGIQRYTTQTPGYNSNDYFTEPPNYCGNRTPYTGPPEDHATGSFQYPTQYQDHRSAMYSHPPETWSGPYGA